MVKEMEKVMGMTVHISSSAPWIKFLLSQMYISIAAGLDKNMAFLVRTNKQFRQLLKDSKSSEAYEYIRLVPNFKAGPLL